MDSAVELETTLMSNILSLVERKWYTSLDKICCDDYVTLSNTGIPELISGIHVLDNHDTCTDVMG